MFLQRFIRKRRQDIKDIRVKSIFHRETKLRSGCRRHEKATHQRGAHLEATQVGRPKWVPPISLVRKSVLYHLRVCIFPIDQGRFDLRALVHPTGLYNPAPTPWVQSIQVI
jgi:hypothetical protein